MPVTVFRSTNFARREAPVSGLRSPVTGNRFLLHVMPARMSRVRKYGWWSSQKKGGELPRIRVALGMPEQVEEREREEQADEPDDFFLDAGEEEEEAPAELMRVVCSACQRLTLVRVKHYPKPTIRRIMSWTLWPELRRDADQLVLPAVEPYLPGGDLYLEAIGFP